MKKKDKEDMGNINQDNLIYIKNKHNDDINLFYESGTHKGQFTKIASLVFENVITVELDTYFYNLSCKNLSEYKGVKTINDSTLNILPKICERDENICFYLDAHFFRCSPPITKSEFPLFKELDILNKRNIKHNDVIIIDDVHTFGKQRPELKLNPSILEWENVIPENLLKYFNYKDYEQVGNTFVIWVQ